MKYYIIAGEASGDLHGANLMRAIAGRDPDADIRFWGGDRMAAVRDEVPDSVGICQVRHIRDLAFMGFVEVLSHLGAIAGNLRYCKADILGFNPDVVVFIDYPGFNLKIAKFTHARGFRNVYYISPQVWAWKKGRLRSMRRDLDSLCYILPSERPFYADGKMPQALYVGHPLLDEVSRYRSLRPVEGDPEPTGDPSQPIVALLPGSRRQELSRTLPLMMNLARRHPDMRFAVAGMSLIGEGFYRKYLPVDLTNVSLAMDATYALLARSQSAIVCSGTATLETALFRVPQVVCYQCNRLSAAIARILIGNKIKYISLVNLIADAPVVSELIQSDFNVDRLDKEFVGIATEGPRRTSVLEGYDRVIAILGGPGASSRTADVVVGGATAQQ